MSINILGLDKAKILAALYNGARVQGMGALHATNKPMTEEEARAELAANPSERFDYLHGRVMKINLSKPDMDPWLFDRDNGEGAALRLLTEAGLIA